MSFVGGIKGGVVYFAHGFRGFLPKAPSLMFLAGSSWQQKHVAEETNFFISWLKEGGEDEEE